MLSLIIQQYSRIRFLHKLCDFYSLLRLEEQGLLEYLNRDVTTQIKEYIAMGGISELLEVGMEKKKV